MEAGVEHQIIFGTDNGARKKVIDSQFTKYTYRNGEQKGTAVDHLNSLVRFKLDVHIRQTQWPASNCMKYY